MKLRIKHIVLGVALLCAIPAFAQPEAGDWEFTLGGSGAADNEFDHGGFSVAGSLGYFATENVEVGVRQLVGFSSAGDDIWSGSTRLFADYHFLVGKFVPFIGANIGYIYGTDFEDTFAAAPEVGFKYYVREKTFIFAQGEYQFFFDDAGEADDTFDDGQFAFTVGVGFNLP